VKKKKSVEQLRVTCYELRVKKPSTNHSPFTVHYLFVIAREPATAAISEVRNQRSEKKSDMKYSENISVTGDA